MHKHCLDLQCPVGWLLKGTHNRWVELRVWKSLVVQGCCAYVTRKSDLLQGKGKGNFYC